MTTGQVSETTCMVCRKGIDSRFETTCEDVKEAKRLVDIQTKISNDRIDSIEKALIYLTEFMRTHKEYHEGQEKLALKKKDMTTSTKVSIFLALFSSILSVIAALLIERILSVLNNLPVK